MNKRKVFSKRVLALLLVIVLTAASVPRLGVTADAAESEEEEGKTKTILNITGYEVSGGSDNKNYELYRQDPDLLATENGNYLWVSGILTDGSGTPLEEKDVRVYYVNNVSGRSSYETGHTDENGVFHVRVGGTSSTGFVAGSTFRVYATFPYSSSPKADRDTYATVTTEDEIVTIVKQTAPTLETQATGKGKSDGSITITDAAEGVSYQYTDDSSYAYADLYDFTENIVSGLSDGIYYVRAKARFESGAESNTLYLASDYAEAEIEEKELQYYIVTLQEDDHASWRGVSGNSFELKEGTDRSVYITPEDGYIVEDVTVEPEDGATVEYNSSTGEVFVSNITENVTLTPIVTEKKVPTNIEVTYKFEPDGNYSEYNAAVRVTFTLTVTDQNGDPAAGAKVYYKQDEKEVSSSLSRTTDENGQITFPYSYALNYDDLRQIEGEWLSQFALDCNFTQGLVSQPIRVVLQQSDNLELYEDQLIGTSTPDAADGKVIKVPENYELYTGTIHQGAITTPADGEWIHPAYNETAGYYEFTGLSGGRQYVIRMGEYADYDNDTFYLASNFLDFMMPRAQWNVTVDTVASEHVIFTEATETTAAPGGTVYIYVQSEEGYEITTYTVDNSNYISDIRYSEEDGYVIIEGITGSITLTVKATEIEEPEPDEEVEEESKTDSLIEEEKQEPETTQPVKKATETDVQEEPETTQLVEEEPETTLPEKEEALYTGDSNSSFAWVVVLTLSLTAIVATGRKRKSAESL